MRDNIVLMFIKYSIFYEDLFTTFGHKFIQKNNAYMIGKVCIVYKHAWDKIIDLQRLSILIYNRSNLQGTQCLLQ